MIDERRPDYGPQGRWTELRTERDRYREALEMIAKGEVGDWSDGDPRRVLVLREIARDALKDDS